MSNIEKYEYFLGESKFDYMDLDFLPSSEIEKLPSYKKMNDRFSVPVFQKTSKTITFSNHAGKKFSYPFTVSKSGKFSYGSTNITPYGKWDIDFTDSWDSIIDFLEIYIVSMSSGLSISQIKGFVQGKSLNPLLWEKLGKKYANNGESYLDILKEKAIKYNGEDSINKILSDLEKKGEGLIQTLDPIIESDFFKRLQKLLDARYEMRDGGKSLIVHIDSPIPLGNLSYLKTSHYYFVINPVKGIKNDQGVYYIGVTDEKTMVNKFKEALIKKASNDLEKYNYGSSMVTLGLNVILEVLTLLIQGENDNSIYASMDDLATETLREIYNKDPYLIYNTYKEEIANDNPDSISLKFFENTFTEKELKRIYIAAIYLVQGIKIFKN